MKANESALTRATSRDEDPYPEWAERRARSPVDHSEVFGAQSLTALSHAASLAVLRDNESFSSSINQETMGPYMGTVMLAKDGAEHTQYRNLVSHAFRASRLEHWDADLIRPTIHELVDRIAPLGRADLVRDITSQYPVRIIAGIIGVPVEDHAKFHAWAEDINTGPMNPERGLAASKAMRDYLTPIVEDRKQHPRDDLISDIVNAEIEGQRLDDEHIYGFLRLLMPAGAETTFRVMGNCLLALLTHPEVLASVRRDLTLIPRVIEETLRWETSVTMISRIAARDTEVAGCPVSRGDRVSVVVASANRDREEHGADADTWRLDRESKPHLAFGWGRHLCLGMHLARLELRIGLGAIVERLPNLRLDPTQPTPSITGFAFRGPEALPVLFDASR
jgi:cytochrome P450